VVEVKNIQLGGKDEVNTTSDIHLGKLIVEGGNCNLIV
jgi:hypothetical protein